MTDDLTTGAVYMCPVRHSCALPVQRIERDDVLPGQTMTMVSFDHLPDGSRLREGMRWRCPVCLALWGAEIPRSERAVFFMPRWVRLTSGCWQRFLRALGLYHETETPGGSDA